MFQSNSHSHGYPITVYLDIQPLVVQSKLQILEIDYIHFPDLEEIFPPSAATSLDQGMKPPGCAIVTRLDEMVLKKIQWEFFSTMVD
jgi:hypothetical protein